jgi:hypothetical protein
MFCLLGLLAEASTLEAISSVRLGSLAEGLPEVLNAVDQIHPSIVDLSYSAIQGFFEVASARLGPAVPAPVTKL